MPRASKPNLNPDQILNSEFQYISQSAFQANEDRSRISSFYLVTVGSFVAAILSVHFEAQASFVSFAFFLLFLVLTGMGALTIAQLARLRAAWHEAAQAMDQIKEYYIANNPHLSDAFKWRMKDIPPTNKPYSIANLMAIEVAMLGAFTAGAAAYFLMTFLGVLNWAACAVVVASVLVGYLAQWLWYKRLLVDD
ncbi:MAG: hypothetical protein LC099_02020 [Anaerolineales bacterium]|nr:hypothetical protein [Anaerolineales bacterium]